MSTSSMSTSSMSTSSNQPTPSNVTSSMSTSSNQPTPSNVTLALNNPNFINNHKQFWQMLCYLFSDFNEQKVWKQLPTNTVRKICIQFHTVLESLTDFAVIQSNRDLLFNVYLMIVKRTKGLNSVSQFHYNESPEFLMALHQIYKIVLTLKFEKIPLFGQASPFHSQINLRI